MGIKILRFIISFIFLSLVIGILFTDFAFANRLHPSINYSDELSNRLYPIQLEITFTAYKNEDIITQSAKITNYEKGSIKVENIASSYLPLHAESYYLTHFNGTWAREMQQEEEKLNHGIKTIETKKGVRTTQAQNPSFLISLNHPSQEDYGDVYAGSLAWSGNFNLSFEVDEAYRLNVVTGMNPFASSFLLNTNENIKTPEMIWTFRFIFYYICSNCMLL